jgi:hypothetical protein
MLDSIDITGVGPKAAQRTGRQISSFRKHGLETVVPGVFAMDGGLRLGHGSILRVRGLFHSLQQVESGGFVSSESVFASQFSVSEIGDYTQYKKAPTLR